MEAPASTTPRVLHLALVTGGDLLDPAGAKLGRVDDLIVRLEDEYPPVSGVLATVAGRQVYVPADAIGEIEHGRVRSARAPARPAALRAPARRGAAEEGRARPPADQRRRRPAGPGQRDRDRAHRRLVPGCRRGHQPAGDRPPGRPAAARRLGRRPAVPRLGEPRAVHRPRADAFACASPPEAGPPAPRPARRPGGGRVAPGGRGDHAGRRRRRRARGRRLRGARPATTSGSSSRSGRTTTWRRCSRGWSPTTPSTCWASWTDERRERDRQAAAAAQRRRVRALLGYDPATAGGLMSPEFVCLYTQATREEALERIAHRRSGRGAGLGLRDGPAAGGCAARSLWPTSCAPARMRSLDDVAACRRGYAPTPSSRRSLA